jgi:hypothetical protein
MTRHSMPFLVLNLGVEMIFVLHSRLRAQAVATDKAEGVMRDICSNLFGTAFMAELFTPQPLYAPAAVRHIFSTLSSSSIMHLSENSMKKLYDLVFMTVKYQVLTLRHPLELYELTLNHLDAVLGLAPASVHPMISEATNQVHGLAATFSVGDWANVRRSLLNFFGGRHVLVSVFLENNVQNSATGAFYIPKDTYLSPSSACVAPGLVQFPLDGSPEQSFEHPDAQLTYPPGIPVGQWDPTSRATRMTTNGFDMYAASTSVSAAAAETSGFADPLGRQTCEMPVSRSTRSSLPITAGSGSTRGSIANSTSTSSAQYGGPVTTTSVNALTHAEKQHAYDAEVSYLAKIAGATNRAPGVQTFELELFDEHDSDGNSVNALPSASGVAIYSATAVTHPPPPPTTCTTTTVNAPAPAVVPLSRMTASAVQEQNKTLLGLLSGLDAPTKNRQGSGVPEAAKGKGGDNLLDIMDEL